MTVCAAAIFDGGVLGVADRMLTSGWNIEFEPPRPKIESLTQSIVVMTAGEAAEQEKIFQQVRADIAREVGAGRRVLVSLTAEMYRLQCQTIRLQRAEGIVLSPLGLDINTWIARQRELDPQLVRQLTSELRSVTHPDIAAIFAGVDPTGTHIYSSDGSDVICNDAAGFASIGAGRLHADSQFMFSRHTKERAFPETMLLAYTAKKRAEVAPGVGHETDMFVIFGTDGTLRISADVLKQCDSFYREVVKKNDKANDYAEKKVKDYVRELSKRAEDAARAAREAATGPVAGGTVAAGGESQPRADVVRPPSGPAPRE